MYLLKRFASVLIQIFTWNLSFLSFFSPSFLSFFLALLFFPHVGTVWRKLIISALITHPQNCFDSIVNNFAVSLNNLNYQDLVLILLVYNTGEGQKVVRSHLQIY